jgi:tetratricopeptide (TPR) repeat protein
MLHEDLTGQWGRALEASDIALPLLHAIPELQEEYYEAVHDRANLLMQTGRIRELVHEAFVALRSLNDGRFPVTRMRLWARAAFGPLTAGHSAQALSFIERARALIDDDTPIPIQIEILSRAVPIYERLGRFTDSLRLGTQRIEMARTNGLRQKLALALMHRGITAEEMGDYVVALADYREAVKLAKEIGDVSTYNRSQLGIFDTYLDLGSIGAARAWWKEYGSFFLSPENRWHRGSIRNMRSYFMELEGHYGEAVRERKEAVTVNTEVGLHAASARSALHVIRMQSLYRLSPMDQVSREYGALAQRIVRKSWTDADFQLRGVGLTVEACGGTVPPETSLEEPPARCPIAWLRQEVYVAKIRWLRAKGRAEEAEALREGYRRERAKIAERVPPEYLADFMNHPLYRVPE